MGVGGLREIAPTLAQLGLSVDELTDSSDALRFDPDAASAVAGTDVVQENGPERPEVKQELWSTIEAGAPRWRSTAPWANSPRCSPARSPGLSPTAAGRPVPRGGPPRRPRGGHRAGAGCGRYQLDRDALGGGRSVSDLPSGGGPGGLADFIVHLGPAREALWAILGQATPGCRHDQAPHDPGRALRRNGGGAGNPSRSGADPPDASPGRTRDRGTAGAMSHQRPARS
jgi:hypothetical protein